MKYISYRGKKTGHDVDILITHPEEDREVGVLPRLLRQLQLHDAILCGKLEKSTFTQEVLYKDSKLSMRGQLDHFEKWIGIFKVPKSASASHGSDVNILYDRKSNIEAEDNGERTSEKTCDGNVEKLNSNGACENGKAHLAKESGTSETNTTTNLNESIDDYEPNAKRQRTCADSDLSPLKLSKQARDWMARRVDLIVSPYSQYFYALVGWTGNKQFNRDLRLYATRDLGMHMTSHGLYDLTKVMSLCLI